MAAGEQSEVVLIEQRFAENLRAIRERAGISQVALAEAMADRGWPWRQQTITRVETGRRTVRLGEAQAIAEILNTSIDRLTQPTEEARAVESLATWVQKAKTAWRTIMDATVKLLEAQALIYDHSAMASGELPDSLRLRRVVQEARRMPKLTPEGAVAQGIAQVASKAAFYADRLGWEGTATIQAGSMADASQIADALRGGYIVILDLREAADRDVQRIIDFVNGAIRVRGGSVRLLDQHAPGNKGRYRLIPAVVDPDEMAISAIGPERDVTAGLAKLFPDEHAADEE